MPTMVKVFPPKAKKFQIGLEKMGKMEYNSIDIVSQINEKENNIFRRRFQ